MFRKHTVYSSHRKFKYTPIPRMKVNGTKLNMFNSGHHFIIHV